MNRIYTTDLDGVCANFQPYFDFYMEMAFKHQKIQINYSTYNLAERYGLAQEDLSEALNKFAAEGLFRDLDILPGAQKVSILRPMVITARPESARSQTVNWLMNKGIRYSGMQFTNDKGYFADPKHILGHFEDNPEFAMDFANKGVKVWLFDYPYNRHINHENIIRVGGWKDIDIGKLADYLD